MNDNLSFNQVMEIVLIFAFQNFLYETIMTMMGGRIARVRDKEIIHLYERHHK